MNLYPPKKARGVEKEGTKEGKMWRDKEEVDKCYHPLSYNPEKEINVNSIIFH